MTSKQALKTMKLIIHKLFDDDYEALTTLMMEEADGKADFLKKEIIELKEICEKALEEL